MIKSCGKSIRTHLGIKHQKTSILQHKVPKYQLNRNPNNPLIHPITIPRHLTFPRTLIRLLLSRLLGSLLNPLLHGIQMRKLPSILTQTPGHNTAQLLRLHDVRVLAQNEVGRVPGPEEIRLAVPVVLAAGFLVCLAILLGAAPGVGD